MARMADRRPVTKPAKRGLDTVSTGDRTTTSSVSLAGPVSRCSMRFWARTDSGLLAKLDCVVSARDRKALEQTAAAARTMIQTATVRHGWRALARASRSGVLISDHSPPEASPGKPAKTLGGRQVEQLRCEPAGISVERPGHPGHKSLTRRWE